MSTFSTQFFAHLIPSPEIVIKPVQLDSTGDRMSNFATAFFEHVFASDVSLSPHDRGALLMVDLDEISYPRCSPTDWAISITLSEQSKHSSKVILVGLVIC